MSSLVVSAAGGAGDINYSSHRDADLHRTSLLPLCSMSKSLSMILPEATTLAFSSSLNDSLSWINPLKPTVPGDSYMNVYTSSFSY